jgi:hypothetical protein
VWAAQQVGRVRALLGLGLQSVNGTTQNMNIHPSILYTPVFSVIVSVHSAAQIELLDQLMLTLTRMCHPWALLSEQHMFVTMMQKVQPGHQVTAYKHLEVKGNLVSQCYSQQSCEQLASPAYLTKTDRILWSNAGHSKKF